MMIMGQLMRHTLLIVLPTAVAASFSSAIAPAEGGTRPNTAADEIAAAMTAVDEAIKTTEALRARLQEHVAAQVRDLLSANAMREEATAALLDGGGTKKIELKIDLPPDLAALVNQGVDSKGEMKFERKANGEIGDLKEATTFGTAFSIDGGSGGGANDEVDVKAVGDASTDASTDTSNDASTNTPTSSLCPLGTYSSTGFEITDSPLYECKPCPEGETTVRVGSTSCRVVTEEDMLNMMFDLLNGDVWNEKYRQTWKSGKPVCEWEGISCTRDGEINGLSIPVIEL
eukprot:CAMPEP_0181095170 /NCGR_PEP_ID=MMETSP1071-20121207/10379_1 /TAXON_ID=35127 /ORGANISM="Thalassiosira sp., Strain NH16" /LENGTH=286 /DNA_ID=CAMNT_0023177539 /DNA_START=1 /DNA_END=861 /DNA_ORIENTATION=+